jgi:alkyl hydroperoxide reductase subunit AhpC
MQVLVVDDEPRIVASLAQLLAFEGFEVETAADGLAGWSAFERDPGRWDLLITDLNMPRLDGLALAERVRSWRADLPIILVCGHAHRLDSPLLQPIAFLAKPFRRHELLEAIASKLPPTWMTLRLGDVPPDLTLPSTDGPLRLHDRLRNRWTLLVAFERDFGPVCTTELQRLAELEGELRRRHVDVLGIAPDSVAGHQRWIAETSERTGLQIFFPLLADPGGRLCTRLGLLERAAVVFGPARDVQLSIAYPAATGRDFDELLRAIDSLQLTAHYRVATPVNWRHGERVVVEVDVDDDEARRRFGEVELLRPYLRFVHDPEWIG